LRIYLTQIHLPLHAECAHALMRIHPGPVYMDEKGNFVEKSDNFFVLDPLGVNGLIFFRLPDRMPFYFYPTHTLDISKWK
jgi:hypothetical protein